MFKTLFIETFHDNSINHTSTILPQAQSHTHVSNTSNPRNPYVRQLSQPYLTQENTKQIQVTISEVPTFFDHLRTILEKTLVTSIDRYTEQVQANKAASQLEAFGTELLHEKATADTSAQMDLSPSVTPQELEELITKSTKKVVSDLSRKIQSLKARLSNTNKNSHKNNKNTRQSSSVAKNSPKRGRKGASYKNKSHNQSMSQSPSPSPNRRNRSNSKKPNRKNHENKSNDSTNSPKRRQSNAKKKLAQESLASRSNSRRN